MARGRSLRFVVRSPLPLLRLRLQARRLHYCRKLPLIGGLGGAGAASSGNILGLRSSIHLPPALLLLFRLQARGLHRCCELLLQLLLLLNLLLLLLLRGLQGLRRLRRLRRLLLMPWCAKGRI